MASNRGGWGQDFINRFQSVPLPEKLECGLCGHERFLNCFSQSQLNRLRQFKARNGRRPGIIPPPVIRCLTCTGEPAVEMECKKCGEIKGINEFSKNQRKGQEETVCFNCTQEIVEGDAPTALREQDWETSTVSDALTNRFADDDESRSGVKGYFDDDDDEDCSVGGGVWVGEQKPGETEKPGKAPMFTAFDPEGYGHTRIADTHRTAPEHPKREKKFAKVPGLGGRNLSRVPTSKEKYLLGDEEEDC